MQVRIIRAAGMAGAMTQVRRELGEEALILTARRVSGGVEVTAALEPESKPAPPALEPARLAALDFHGVPRGLQPSLAAGAPEVTLEAALKFGALPLSSNCAPLLVAGPPGAGKTLTVARLATRLVLAGTAPMVITADGKRAGAAEQLAAFTRLLGINLVVANHPVTLGRALERRQEGGPVLIDTPGCDPFDPTQAREIAALAQTAGANIALVLPAGMDCAEASDLGRAFAALGATLMVATRLDIARRLGAVIAAAMAGGLALAEAGVGPGAADGLTPLTPALLASRLQHTRNPCHDKT
jgi:flagellar biosynthesis protein FlhF